MQRTFESEALIRFPDCDPFNHLNNARYLDYFINAREDHLMRNLDFNIYAVAQERGTSWVVAMNRIAYLKPALLMETVVIDSTILNWGEREVLVEMRMWDREKRRLKALLWSTFVHVDLRSGRPVPHSEEYNARFKPLEAPLSGTHVTFEDRVEELRGKTAAEVPA